MGSSFRANGDCVNILIKPDLFNLACLECFNAVSNNSGMNLFFAQALKCFNCAVMKLYIAGTEFEKV